MNEASEKSVLRMNLQRLLVNVCEMSVPIMSVVIISPFVELFNCKREMNILLMIAISILDCC